MPRGGEVDVAGFADRVLVLEVVVARRAALAEAEALVPREPVIGAGEGAFGREPLPSLKRPTRLQFFAWRSQA